MQTTTLKKTQHPKKSRAVVRKESAEMDLVIKQAQSYLQETEIEQCYFSGYDAHLLKEGSHFRMYEKMGAHIVERGGIKGVWFSVWAPNAQKVSVIGDFNGWKRTATPLILRQDGTGIWQGFVSDIGHGHSYKYYILTRQGWELEKADPFAMHSEVPPKSASLVWDIGYQWRDQSWMETRKERNALDKPMSVYEVHLGSWMRSPEDGGRSLTYLELADKLTAYVKQMGYTHVELMPVMAHPFQGSWGYQLTGFFSPASFFGNPQGLMTLIDRMHQNDIGVILDWVPSHFPNDGHGLYQFDGTHLFEHEDMRKGFHPDWKSSIFNYGRVEVRSFLISSALFWLEKFHADGLRVDGVASMLYLDYSRKEGEWIPNENGGRENLEAIDFIQCLNEAVYGAHPDIQMIAEESTAWTKVSKPIWEGGLGFGMKWNMGWMHDTLEYFTKDAIYRKHHHGQLTFGLLYAFTENFMMSLSHDEVVHGKGSLLNKMPGDDWQKFANLRLLFGYMYGQPGKKLHFMGGEFGQWDEWKHEASLDWHLLAWAPHQGVQAWMRDLNKMYREEPALYQLDFTYHGFEWIECGAWEDSVLMWVRKGYRSEDDILVVCNLTPVLREEYRVGVPSAGYWREILNSDGVIYGGCDKGNGGGCSSEPTPWQGREQSISMTLPPLGVLYLKRQT